jgi:hypothetical protein
MTGFIFRGFNEEMGLSLGKLLGFGKKSDVLLVCEEDCLETAGTLPG